MEIRKASEADLTGILGVHARAFGRPEEAGLVNDLLADPSADPTLLFLACDGERTLGHILFTSARLETDASVVASLLAPLAVDPSAQRQGIGSALTAAGLQHLAANSVDLVFVLGDPAFYGRFHFVPAVPLGLETPYPLPESHTDAWRVRPFRQDRSSFDGDRVLCAETLDKPELWRE